MQSSNDQQSLNQDDNCILLDNLKKRKFITIIVTALINGINSFVFALIFIQLEGPKQCLRIQAKDDLKIEVISLRNNLTKDPTLETFLNYSSKLKNLSKIDNTKEIIWDMLSSIVFVTSIHSTTGYGNIVPQTTGGKVCATVYAIFGIPLFIWYIIQLRDIFRILLMRIIYGGVNIFRKLCVLPRDNDNVMNFYYTPSDIDKMETETMFKSLITNKKFTSCIIFLILIIYMISAAGFISYMENITYFDAFYASFITYSTIGFGDIDIYGISVRACWFNLFVYGTFVHALGYVMVSAWISSILEMY